MASELLPGSETVIRVDFVPGESNPRTVFETVLKLIEAVENIDNVTAEALSVNIETKFVLERIEAGSVKAFINRTLKRIDIHSVEEGKFKHIAGALIAEIVETVINWTEDDSKHDKDDALIELQGIISDKAKSSKINKLESYQRPKLANIAKFIESITEAKTVASRSESMFVGKHDKPVPLNPRSIWGKEELRKQIEIDIETIRNQEMILYIKKADYLGKSKWLFKYDNKPIEVKITDMGWIDRFHRREFDLRPGDALKCIVDITVTRDNQGFVVDRDYDVKKVVDVIKMDDYQEDLFD